MQSESVPTSARGEGARSFPDRARLHESRAGDTRNGEAVVTFDLFSALLDSRTGGGEVLGQIANERGWAVSGVDIYDAWDQHNKALQARAEHPATFSGILHQALVFAYGDLDLSAHDAKRDSVTLKESIAAWPAWPDVPEALAAFASTHRTGLLSNVDEDVVQHTQVYPLVDPSLVLTSQRLRAFKPHPGIYTAARRAIAPARLIHVAASARDVRGALEAGVETVRFVRPGHTVDTAGPQPSIEISRLQDLSTALSRLAMELRL